jgi:opacity protein-like surface antigen
MHLAKSALLIPFFLLASVAPSLAQEVTAPQAAAYPVRGGYVAALAGPSFGPQFAAAFAGEFGEDLHPDVQAYATFSYFENLMQKSMRNQLSQLSAALSTVTGTLWDLHGRDRGVTFIAGARYLAGAGGSVRPYLAGGAGVINLKRTIVESRVGDVTSALLSEFGLGEVSLTTTSATRPLVEAGGGVSFVAGPTYVDIGYRYKRAFRMTEGLDFSQLAVGVGYKF